MARSALFVISALSCLISSSFSWNIDELSLPTLSDAFEETEKDLLGDDEEPTSVPIQSNYQIPLTKKANKKLKKNKTMRKIFPQNSPDVCVCFLSCCGRTDLLQKTMQAAIKHFEEDETNVNYEIAWVDNGSPDAKNVDVSEIEHVNRMEENMGLAWGLNTLFFDMCTAPYVLILEEDWMYMDNTVASQTLMRRNAVSRALEVAGSNTKAYDGRQVMGVFLRPETYDTFLKPPFVSQWQRTRSGVEHKIYCADISGGSGYLWGSFTNGAGLYSRAALSEIGQMFGEPGDGFHDAYVEANYAYRAGLKYCHSMLRMEEGCDTCNGCNAAFYHIGGGRGTRPNKKKDIEAPDDSWVFYGTNSYPQVLKMSKQNRMDQERLNHHNQPYHQPQHENWKSSQKAQQQYQAKISDLNAEVFAEEQAQREEMRQQAFTLKNNPPDVIRQHAPALASMSDQEILALADQLEERANSPHPLPGFWDGMGHPLKERQQQGGVPVGGAGGGGGGEVSSSYRDDIDDYYDDEDEDDEEYENLNSHSQHQLKKSYDQYGTPDISEVGNNPEIARLVEEKANALRSQAKALYAMGPSKARMKVKEFKDLSDEEILNIASSAESVAENREYLIKLVYEENKMKSEQNFNQNNHNKGYQSPEKNVKKKKKKNEVQNSNPQPMKKKKDRVDRGGGKAGGVPQQPERSSPLPLHLEQDGEHNKLAYEAEIWSRVAHEHERQGHRAFTGNGYQEQYKMVQEELKRRGAVHAETKQRGMMDVIRRAIFGPGAN